MVPAPAKPLSTSFMTVAVAAMSLSWKSVAGKIGVVPPMMLVSLGGSGAVGAPNRLAGLADVPYGQSNWVLVSAYCVASLYTCTPAVRPLGMPSAAVKALGSPLPDVGVVPLLMRVCDSSTATASGSSVPPGGIGTSEVASEGWLMVVGCSDGSSG